MDALIVLSLLWFHVAGALAIGGAARNTGRSAMSWALGALVASPIVVGLALMATVAGERAPGGNA